MARLALGIDVGTTTAKAVLADAEGRLLADHTAAYVYSKPRPGWAEQHPEDWWQAVCRIVRALLSQQPGAKERIAAVGVSGQGVASVLLDRQGKALRPAIIWLDCRSAPQADQIQARSGERIAAISGKNPAPYNVEPKLLWVKQNEPEIWKRVWKTLTTTAYINYRLTARAVMNHSDGGILLGYDLARREWSQETIELMGIPPSVYCELAPCHEVIGAVTQQAAEETGLRQGTPVIAGGEDTSAAGLAMGATSSETAQLSMGSASTVYVPLANSATDPRLLAFPHVIEGLTLVGGSMVAGGTAMDWITGVISEASCDNASGRIQALTSEAAQVPAGSEGLIFLPYLAGELQPINNGFARGVFFGLDLSKTRGHFIRAVMEGTALAIEHNLSITQELGAEVRRLVAVGGPTRNRLWCQIIADVTGIPIQVVHERGGAALGDAILAAMGAGLIESTETMQRHHVVAGECFVPDSGRRHLYQETFRIYRDLYPQLKELFPRLANLPQPEEGAGHSSHD
jgi:xylulokinase